MEPDRRLPRWMPRIAMRTVLLCVVAILWVALAATAKAQPAGSNASAAQDPQDPPIRVGRLARLRGQVSVEPAGVDQWTEASANYPLTTGDRLYADRGSRVELQMEQTVVRVWQLTDLSVTNLTDTITQLGVSQGSLHVRTFGLTAGHTVEIDTPNGAITVMQPGDFRVDCYTADGGTVVTVNSGEVGISGPSLSNTLAAGQSIRLMGTSPITSIALGVPGRDAFDAWSELRDRQMLSSQTRQYVDPDTIGSDDLGQYGTWGQVPEYGPVWYPAAVPVGWVPYSTGRWVWVSPWGWTWVDSYPWGFAPFHYGRWAFVGSRWGWVPGPFGVAPVYSPALVGFVGGAQFSDDGVGLSAWFPLGPGEPYYPWYHCSPRYFTQVNITNIRRVIIHRTNYYNYYHDRTVFNHVRYVNRRVGTVAVHASEFASGRALNPQTVIRPDTRQLARAQIIPHPFVSPTRASVVPHPVTAVPMSVQRPALLTTRGELKPAPGGHGALTQWTPSDRVQPTLPAASRQSSMSSNPRPGSAPQPATGTESLHDNITPRTAQNLEMNRQPVRQQTPQFDEPPARPLIARTLPPAPRPTFEQRQPAYRSDPGRPLGPQQERNLSQGRPAGPSRVPEFPPHPSWAPKPNSAPRAGSPRR